MQPPHYKIVTDSDATLYWHTESNTLKAGTKLPDHCEQQARFQITDMERSSDVTLKLYAPNQDEPQSLVVASIPPTERVDDQVVRFQLSVSIYNC